MELRQLRYFILLARELNYTNAARKLNISQPTLSQQIAAMENELGSKVFNRSKREVTLTEAGKMLLRYGEDLLYQFDSMVRRVQALNNTPVDKEVLTIGVDTNDHDLDLWDVIKGITYIHRSHPQAEFRFVTVPFSSIQSAVENNDIDVGFYTLPRGADWGLHVYHKVLKEDTISMGVPESLCQEQPDLDISSALRSLPVCLLEGDLRWGEYFENLLRRYCPDLKIKAFTSDGLLFDYISAGLGIYLDTTTLFHMKRSFPVREFIIEDKDVGAIEIAVWNENNPNGLRDLLMDFIQDQST